MPLKGIHPHGSHCCCCCCCWSDVCQCRIQPPLIHTAWLSSIWSLFSVCVFVCLFIFWTFATALSVLTFLIIWSGLSPSLVCEEESNTPFHALALRLDHHQLWWLQSADPGLFTTDWAVMLKTGWLSTPKLQAIQHSTCLGEGKFDITSWGSCTVSGTVCTSFPFTSFFTSFFFCHNRWSS